MKYAQVVDGVVVRTSSKPTVRHEKDYVKYGWFPVVEDRPDVSEGFKELGARSESFDGEQVIFTYAVRIISLDDYKAKKIRSLNKQASSSFPSFHKQINSLFGLLTNQEAAVIKKQVNDVRDEIHSKEDLILAAVDYAEVDSVYSGIVALLDPAKIDENGFPIPQPLELE